MSGKKHRLTDRIEFSIDIEHTLNYLSYHEQYSSSGFNNYFHIATDIYKDGDCIGALSVFIQPTGVAVEEVNRIKRHREDYEPSEEFIHILRGAIILVAMDGERVETLLHELICNAITQEHYQKNLKNENSI